MTTIFVDTNIFLHAKPLQEIPWEEREQPPVTIIITRPVIKELDHHKDNHPKRHLRERARKALQRIEAASTNPQLRPNVLLRVDHHIPRINWEDHDLDPANPDDQLIASIIDYRTNHPSETIVLYTHDIGPRLNANRFGIATKPIPDEDQLPPQKDEIEKENERLRQELHELNTAAPQLTIRINDEQQEMGVETLALAPPPLDIDAIQRESTAARDKLPTPPHTMIAADDDLPSSATRILELDKIAGYNFHLTPASEYQRYEHEREEYRENYLRYLRSQHDVRELQSRTLALELTLHNNGGKPAEDIHLGIIIPRHITISEHPPLLPAAPTPPRLPRTQAELFATSLQGMYMPPATDLYNPLADINPWRRGPEIDAHKVTWWFKILNHRFTHDLGTLYLQVPTLTPFSITYDIHAANSIKPFTGSIVIKPTRSTKDD